MSGQVKQYGTLSIPDYKIDAFLHDVRQVADQAGLLAIRHMRAYDEEFDLLCFPVDDGCSCIFDYSYFEDAVYDKVVIDVKTGNIHIGNTGFGQFGMAVQALCLLAESYSEKNYYTDNRFSLSQNEKLRWLGYVLHRSVKSEQLNNLWEYYEQYILDNGEDAKLSAMDFFNSYVGDAVDFDDINTIIYVNDIINKDYIYNRINQKESSDKSKYAFWVQSMARFLWLAKRDSMKSEKDLLSRYMRLLHNVSKIREEIISGVNVSPVKEIFATVAPPITVKLIATIYGLDFWQMWGENKEKINVTSSIYYHNMANENAENQDVNLAPITTEEFFEVGSEDRLYWWQEDGDVIIDGRTRQWLEQMAEQHRTHVATMDEEFSAIE